MGHASPETTAGYVHLSVEHLAAELQIGQERGDVLGVESLGKAPWFADQLPAPAR